MRAAAALPLTRVTCYACAAPAIGVRDRRPEGALVEAACARHRDPSLASFVACAFCLGRRPGAVVDGDRVHVACHKEASL